MTDNETFVVQSAIPERLYVKTYHDFLDSTIINGKEKIIFILLKRYLNFSLDDKGIEGKVYPTLETLSKQAGMTKKTVADIIKKLEEKKLIDVKQQGLNKPNIYTLRDFSGIWNAKNDEDLQAAIDTYEEECEDFRLIERLQSRGYKVTKEKELDSEPTKAQKQALKKNLIDKNNDTVKSAESQVLERYSLDDIRVFFDYEIMITDRPFEVEHIDSVMNILHTIMNKTKGTIRIIGEDKPVNVVIAKLMKLTYSEILYAIDKFKEQTGRIKNPTSYMLTLLYNAKEQMNLDITNQVQHDLCRMKSPTEK